MVQRPFHTRSDGRGYANPKQASQLPEKSSEPGHNPADVFLRPATVE